MSTPGYPYMDGPQSMDWPNQSEGTENIPTGMGGMHWPDPSESSTPMQGAAIQEMTAHADMGAAQQGMRDALRATNPLPVDPDGDND